MVCSLDDCDRFGAIKEMIHHRIASRKAFPYVVSEKWKKGKSQRRALWEMLPDWG